MDIDLNKYTMQELYEINSAVVRQIKAMQKADAKEKSVEFKIGQDVWFVTRSGERVEGKLARFLTKWKVSPHLVKAVEPSVKEDVVGSLGGDDVETFVQPPSSAMDKPRTGHSEAW